MRVPVALLMLTMFLPATAAGAPINQNANPLGGGIVPNCPRTTSHLADKTGVYRGQPPAPRKLTELPPATTYMAVYRVINGCEAPLTMADYRNPRRR